MKARTCLITFQSRWHCWSPFRLKYQIQKIRLLPRRLDGTRHGTIRFKESIKRYSFHLGIWGLRVSHALVQYALKVVKFVLSTNVPFERLSMMINKLNGTSFMMQWQQTTQPIFGNHGAPSTTKTALSFLLLWPDFLIRRQLQRRFA